MTLKVGDKAPDFELDSTSGEKFVLSDAISKGDCIVYFYPMDFTKGCTTQACNLRNEFDLFIEKGIKVVGINKGSLSTHKKFIEKHKLPFDLLEDKGGKVSKKYEAIIPVIGLVKRTTYLIGSDGTIKFVIDGLFNIDKHIDELVKELK